MRIIRLGIVGFGILFTGGLFLIGAVGFVRDLSSGGNRSPEFLGSMTAWLLMTIGLVWLWRKIRRDTDSQTKSAK